MKRIYRAGFKLALTCLCSSFAYAATITVGPGLGKDHATIQAAIDAATPGDEIIVDAGTYNENLTINQHVDITGAGSGVGGTVITAAGSQVVSLAASGNNAADPIALSNLRIEPQANYGINVASGTVDYVSMNNVHIVGPGPTALENEVALKVSTTSTLRHVTISNCAFTGCDYGWYFAKHDDWGPGGSVVEDIVVTNSSFNNNDFKAVYVEKLSETTFDGCEFKNNGDAAFWNSVWNGGIDINLKGEETYQNISILNSVFEGNGLGYKEGAAIMIKGRDDGTTYGAHPASLDGVIISGNTITGNERGIRFGEPGKGNASPTNVTLSNNNISGNVQTYTGNDGSPYGDVINAVAIEVAGIPAASSVINVASGGTLQAAIAAASAGDTINVAAGTYVEVGQILIDKDLTIVGADAATVIIKPNHSTSGGSYDQANGWFAVETGVTFNLSNVTLDGAGQTIKMAIIARGTLVAEDCVIKNISSHQYLGWGIAILDGAASIVRRCEFSGIQRIGVHIRGNVVIPTPSALVEDCTFTGKGPGDWVEYGVEFGGGGSGTVQGCTFSGYRGVASTDGSKSAAILATDFYGNGTNAVITGNTITDCTSAIVVGYDTPDMTVLDANNNSISGCDNGVLTTANVVVTAAQNYWGAPDGPSGAGQGAGVSVPANITFSPYFKNAAFTDAGPVKTLEIPAVGYATIQGAIDAATTVAGNTVLVDAGTYQENVTVNKSVTIQGPNAGIAGNGFRGAEAIVYSAISDIGDATIFNVTTDDVTITGLVIDGDNPALTSGYFGTNGADQDAAMGVQLYQNNINNLVVENNIIQNFSYFGVLVYGLNGGSSVATTGHEIKGNLIKDLGTYDAASGIARWGGAVLLYYNQYAQVTNNTITNARIGIQTGQFAKPNPGVSPLIDGNTIAVRSLGVFHNELYVPGTPFVLSNNTVTAVPDANETKVVGILLSGLRVPSTVTGNMIDLSAVDSMTINSKGYEVWNVPSSGLATINGGSVTGTRVGLFLNNYEGYNTNATHGAHAAVSGLAISASTTGIRVLDSPNSTTHAAVELTVGSGVTVTGGTNGLAIEGANAKQSDASDLALSGQSGDYIQLIDNAFDVDATSVQFDGKTGSSMDLGELLAVEAKVLHNNDNAALGTVTWKSGFVVSPIVIADAQTTGDMLIPAGTKVEVTETGSLVVTGKIELAAGAELVVNGGSLEIGDGSVISGTFTIFNSFGSWNINGDTTFNIGQSLALVTDIHVAAGKTMMVNGGGELILDGCVINSQTPGSTYNIIVDVDGVLTIARSNVTDAVIDINTVEASVATNLQSRIYDNGFTNSDIEATNDSVVYHNLFDAATNGVANSDGSTTAFGDVDGWGNVTDANDLKNKFTLSFDDPSPLAGRTLDSDGNLFVQTNDPVVMKIDVGTLDGHTINATEALLGYNSDRLVLNSTNPAVTASAGWHVELDNSSTASAPLGLIDSTLGLNLADPGDDGIGGPATIANVLFAAGTPGMSAGFFRVQTNGAYNPDGSFVHDTRLTKSLLGVASFLSPFTENTGSVVVDNDAPVINDASATATQDQPSFTAVNVLDSANPMFRQASNVIVAFNATDNGHGLSGLDAADAGDDLVLEMVQGATTQPLVLNTDYTITSAVDSSGVVTYTLSIDPAFATVSGTYELNAMVRDRSGNFSTNTQLSTFLVQNEALVNVELQDFVGTSRDVTFVATGGVQKSWTKTVSNFAGAALGSVILEDVPAGTTHISAKTAWNLRSKVALVGGINGQAVLTGADLLPGGDITGDNVVNTLDYSTLRYHWLTTNSIADINGDGEVKTSDYSIFSFNFYTGGDPE